MKNLFLFIVLAGMCATALAQYPVRTIREIQERSAMDLANCEQQANFQGDTVIVYGTITTDGFADVPAGTTDRRNARPGAHHNVWMHDGYGAWSGLDIFHLNGETSAGPTTPTSMIDLQAGDSVKITGVIAEFSESESEIFPIPGGVEIVGTGLPPVPTRVAVADLNKLDMMSGQSLNDVTTGEQYEGVYIEINNVTVTAVVSSGPFITLADSAGNEVQISNRFYSMLPASGYVAPPIGTKFDTIRGICAHGRENGCIPNNGNGEGYQIYPFKQSDLVVGAGVNLPPNVSDIRRSPVQPADNEDCVINATATDSDGSIATVELFYAIGTGSFSTITMTPISMGSDTYTASIPSGAYADGDLVSYYICATDNGGETSCTPNIPDNQTPNFFYVNNGPTTIVDVQRVPASFEYRGSSFDGLEVTVSGVVTASAQSNDLGNIFIQLPGENQWAGLYLTGNPGLAALTRGDSVEVSGTIDEYQGNLTRMFVDQVTTAKSGVAVPAAQVLDLDLFNGTQDGAAEPYEGMLITLANPNADKGIYVGADGGFGEYYVVNDSTQPTLGMRTQAGRKDGDGNISSLFNGYLADLSWANNDGNVTVDICVVTQNDTMKFMTGMVYYSFGAWKIYPRESGDVYLYSGANCSDGLAGLRVNNDLDELKGVFRIYPNPASSVLNVSYDLANPVNGVVELRDMMGRTVATTAINGTMGTATLRTDVLVSGTYTLIAKDQNQVLAVEKIMIK